MTITTSGGGEQAGGGDLFRPPGIQGIYKMTAAVLHNNFSPYLTNEDLIRDHELDWQRVVPRYLRLDSVQRDALTMLAEGFPGELAVRSRSAAGEGIFPDEVESELIEKVLRLMMGLDTSGNPLAPFLQKAGDFFPDFRQRVINAALEGPYLVHDENLVDPQKIGDLALYDKLAQALPGYYTLESGRRVFSLVFLEGTADPSEPLRKRFLLVGGEEGNRQLADYVAQRPAMLEFLTAVTISNMVATRYEELFKDLSVWTMDKVSPLQEELAAVNRPTVSHAVKLLLQAVGESSSKSKGLYLLHVVRSARELDAWQSGEVFAGWQKPEMPVRLFRVQNAGNDTLKIQSEKEDGSEAEPPLYFWVNKVGSVVIQNIDTSGVLRPLPPGMLAGSIADLLSAMEPVNLLKRLRLGPRVVKAGQEAVMKLTAAGNINEYLALLRTLKFSHYPEEEILVNTERYFPHEVGMRRFENKIPPPRPGKRAREQ